MTRRNEKPKGIKPKLLSDKQLIGCKWFEVDYNPSMFMTQNKLMKDGKEEQKYT